MIRDETGPDDNVDLHSSRLQNVSTSGAAQSNTIWCESLCGNGDYTPAFAIKCDYAPAFAINCDYAPAFAIICDRCLAHRAQSGQKNRKTGGKSFSSA